MAYDVIDLDPYGSVSPFVDAAVQAGRAGTPFKREVAAIGLHIKNMTFGG